MHRLNKDAQGRVKCVACFLCATACPAHCIDIVAAESPWPDREKYPESFVIDELRCIYCGMCEEACPVDAIELTSLYNLTGRSREEMVFDKEKLLSVYRRDEGPGADAVGDGGRYGMSLVQWIPWVVVAGQQVAAEGTANAAGATPAAGELTGWPLFGALVLGVIALCLLLPATTGSRRVAGGVLGLLVLLLILAGMMLPLAPLSAQWRVLVAGRGDVDCGRGGRCDAQTGLHGALVCLVAAGYGGAAAV